MKTNVASQHSRFFEFVCLFVCLFVCFFSELKMYELYDIKSGLVEEVKCCNNDIALMIRVPKLSPNSIFMLGPYNSIMDFPLPAFVMF